MQRQNPVQLARAPAQGRGEAPIPAMHLPVRRAQRIRLLQAVTQEAPQIVLGVAPGIALIVNKALHQGQRDDRTVAVRVFQGAGQRRDVAKSGDIAQETAHLQFGVDARPQASINLEQHAATDVERSVAAIQGQAFDRQGPGRLTGPLAKNAR